MVSHPKVGSNLIGRSTVVDCNKMLCTVDQTCCMQVLCVGKSQVFSWTVFPTPTTKSKNINLLFDVLRCQVMCFSSASHVYTCPVYAVGKLIGEVCCTADKSGGDVWVQARSIGANYFGLEESSIALVEVRLDNKEVLGVTESSRVGLPEVGLSLPVLFSVRFQESLSNTTAYIYVVCIGQLQKPLKKKGCS